MSCGDVEADREETVNGGSRILEMMVEEGLTKMIHEKHLAQCLML